MYLANYLYLQKKKLVRVSFFVYIVKHHPKLKVLEAVPASASRGSNPGHPD